VALLFVHILVIKRTENLFVQDKYALESEENFRQIVPQQTTQDGPTTIVARDLSRNQWQKLMVGTSNNLDLSSLDGVGIGEESYRDLKLDL
jgi:hypothetical protein